MTDLLLPGAVLGASLAMTYYFCLRPMRRGHCDAGGRQTTTDGELELALMQARLDLARLQADLIDQEWARAGRSEPSDAPGDDDMAPPGRARRTL